MLGYAFRVVMNLIQNRTYRGELLRTLVKLYRGLTTPDYVQMCQCLIFLDEPMAVADILGMDRNSITYLYKLQFEKFTSSSGTSNFLY